MLTKSILNVIDVEEQLLDDFTFDQFDSLDRVELTEEELRELMEDEGAVA